MSGFCGRFSFGALYQLGCPIQHHLPFCKTGAVHQVEVELDDPRLSRAKPLDPLLAMYSTRIADIRRETGGNPVLVRQDLFSKDYLHNCLIVSLNFQDSVVYEKNKSPSIKMRYDTYNISHGHFYILHIRPIVLRIGREITTYHKKRNPMPICDLSGAECIICSHPYDKEKHQRLQVCSLPCAEGFHCLECYKDLRDKSQCSVCRQSANPALSTMTLYDTIEKQDIKELSIINCKNEDMIGWIGLAFHDETRFKVALGVALLRRAMTTLDRKGIFKDFESISANEMGDMLLRSYQQWLENTDFNQFSHGTEIELSNAIKALVATEDERIALRGQCEDYRIKCVTFCKGCLVRLAKMTEEKRLEEMVKLKENAIWFIKQKFNLSTEIKHMVPYIKREDKEEIIQL